jgi:hypothetical protein
LRRRSADKIPPRVFRDALQQTVMADDAPDGVRATPEQQVRIKDLVREQEAAVRAYMQQHRDELAALREKGVNIPGKPGQDVPGRERGGKKGQRAGGAASTDTDDPMSDMRDQKRNPTADAPSRGKDTNEPALQAARERARELMQNAPQFEEVYAKIWAELSEPQKAALDAELDRFRARQAEQREEAYVRQRVGERQAGREQVQAAPRAVAPGEGERRERMMRIWDRMTPEQQEQLLTRIEQRMAGERTPGDKPGNRPGDKPGPVRRGQPKPPPAMEDVNVPDDEQAMAGTSDQP